MNITSSGLARAAGVAAAIAGGIFVAVQVNHPAEAAFDTHGMVVAKRRSDLFRHWLLGLGSGDLIVKAAGAHPKQIEMSNVLFISSKLRLVQEMLQTRETVHSA